MAFLYTSNKQSETEIKIKSFIKASKHTKYLGINLTKKKKNVRGLYPEHHKTLLREIKDDLNKWTMGSKTQYCCQFSSK